MSILQYPLYDTGHDNFIRLKGHPFIKGLRPIPFLRKKRRPARSTRPVKRPTRPIAKKPVPKRKPVRPVAIKARSPRHVKPRPAIARTRRPMPRRPGPVMVRTKRPVPKKVPVTKKKMAPKSPAQVNKELWRHRTYNHAKQNELRTVQEKQKVKLLDQKKKQEAAKTTALEKQAGFFSTGKGLIIIAGLALIGGGLAFAYIKAKGTTPSN